MTQREVLLATAERLFAERGVDGTSLRTVMAEAGTNVAAVHYHFGSKDDLLAAVVQARSDAVRAAREERLAALEVTDQPTVRGLAEAFVLPVAELALAGDVAWIRLVTAITTSRREPGWQLVNDAFAPQAVRLGRILDAVRPGLALATVRFRLAEATSLCFRVLGDLDFVRANVGRPGPPADADQVVADLLDAVTAILGGPEGSRHRAG